MYHIAICDDKQEFIEYTKRLIQESQRGIDAIFYEYHSGESLVCQMQQIEHYDLLILDMQLETMDGNQTARKFREKFPDTLLVFCSGIHLPTVENFEVSPFRYLLKSYTDERMREELDIILEKMRNTKYIPNILGRRNNIITKIAYKDIWYIELIRRGSIMHCHLDKEEEEYSTTLKLKELYEKLKDFDFVYAHNSYIVNMQHVVMAGLTELELSNEKKLSIARSKSKEFRQSFVQHITQKY